MSETTPPLRYDDPRPRPRRRFGCLGCLVVVIVLVLGTIFGVQFAILHTAVPFRLIASVIEKANPNIRITGISGDLLTGPRVRSITWGEDGTHPTSELSDLRIRYSSLSDIRVRKRLIIEDAGVAKAHIDLADLGDWKKSESDSSDKDDTSSSSGGHTSSGSHRRRSSTSSSSSAPPGTNDLQAFEIRQVLIQDVLITNRNSPFRLSIPKVSWKGFRVTREEGNPGDIEIESDRLTVHTKPGRTLQLGDQKVAFQKTFEGVLQPLAYDGILQPIRFVWDVTVGGEMNSATHLSLADGQIESWVRRDKQRHLSVRHLELSRFLDPKKVYGANAADLPSDVNFEVSAAAGEPDLRTASGSLKVGVMTFTITPEQPANEDEGDPATLRATHEEAGQKIVWSLPTDSWPWKYQPSFESEPQMEPKELLARVFHGKAFAELSPEEQKQVEQRETIYFPPTTKPGPAPTTEPEAPVAPAGR